MLRISKFFEEHKVRLNQTCPLRHTEVPANITLQEKFFNTRLTGEYKNAKGATIWKKILKMDDKVFKQQKRYGYEFYNTIQTDGVFIEFRNIR